MRAIIISGSSRHDGNTSAVVNLLRQYSGWDAIDLNDYEISYYDYQHLNKDDDFIPLMRKIVDHYDTIILATPVYWYSMSGIMKVFFDRISDLITIEKELGRKLRGKKMASISASGGNDLGELFWLPFRKSAEYLGMIYLGDLHVKVNEDHDRLEKGMTEAIGQYIDRITEKYSLPN